MYNKRMDHLCPGDTPSGQEHKMGVAVRATGAYWELATCQARFPVSQQEVTHSDPRNASEEGAIGSLMHRRGDQHLKPPS